MALDMVESQFKVRLPESEAAFIAMHIANGETDDSTMEETFAITKIIEDICNIVRVYFRIEMDADSSYYYRFITHLKYFAKYEEAYRCACKIGDYLSRKYHYQLLEEERMYLTIHIRLVVNKGSKMPLEKTPEKGGQNS